MVSTLVICDIIRAHILVDNNRKFITGKSTGDARGYLGISDAIDCCTPYAIVFHVQRKVYVFGGWTICKRKQPHNFYCFAKRHLDSEQNNVRSQSSVYKRKNKRFYLCT